MMPNFKDYSAVAIAASNMSRGGFLQIKISTIWIAQSVRQHTAEATFLHVLAIWVFQNLVLRLI